ncbi:MAG: RNB domain-containing ribonuclease [Novosphingobium sp.]
MKSLNDPDQLLSDGLAAIRQQFKVPAMFPPAVLAAAEAAARRVPSAHADRTAVPFVTLDPASSTDLDQAFWLERSGGDFLLHYAITDVAWFVDDGGVIDAEAWARGTTTYLPDGKASLYPPIISEHAASLLPDGDRPAVIFTSRIGPDGEARLQGVERAVIRSRAKLAYDTVRAVDLSEGFAEFAGWIAAAEDRRGAARVDPPEQELQRGADGRFRLSFRPRLPSEDQNAALSLASNLAVARALYKAGTGLFRVMAGPDERALLRLRGTAKAFALDWGDGVPLADFEKTLNAADPRQAAFMMAVRRSGNGASYVPYAAGVRPWHAAMAATYAHSTAPLRRLADRYVVQAALAVANGLPVPDAVSAAFQKLPAVMARAEAHDGQVERAAIDLAESAQLSGREGEAFSAVVTDIGESGARIQLCDVPVVARVTAHGVLPGAPIKVRLTSADLARRLINFERIE